MNKIILNYLSPTSRLHKVLIMNMILLLIFSMIYYFLFKSGDHFHIKYKDESYLDSLYYTIVTQAFLGYGDIYPISKTAKIVVIIHVFIMLIIIMS